MGYDLFRSNLFTDSHNASKNITDIHVELVSPKYYRSTPLGFWLRFSSAAPGAKIDTWGLFSDINCYNWAS